MKYKLKLLKDWTDPSGQNFKAGVTIEIGDKKVVGELLTDGIAEKAAEDINNNELKSLIGPLVTEGIKAAMKDAPQISTDKMVHIEIRDKSDDDPTGGYLPQQIGDKYSKEQLEWGLGQFAKDVYDASQPGAARGERLTKSMEHSKKMIEDSVKKGYITKASGDKFQIGVEADGGFLVHPEFSLMLNEASLETAVVRPRAQTMQITSDSIELPQPVNYDHSTPNVYGGFVANWGYEDKQLVESRMQWEEVKLSLNPLTIFAKATHKMMKFSPIAVGSYILPKMGDAIAWFEDDAFIDGTGAGQPLGIIKAPGKVTVAIESGQDLTPAFVSENADKMYGRAKIDRLSSTVWLFNKADLWNDLAGMSRDVGTGGSTAGLLEKMPNSPQMTMYGIPLVDTEHCPAAGTVGDIILTDLSQYLIADHRSGPEIAQSMHLNFDYGKECFRIIKYVDGQPRWRSAFTRQNSTNTYSSIVVLNTRTA